MRAAETAANRLGRPSSRRIKATTATATRRSTDVQGPAPEVGFTGALSLPLPLTLPLLGGCHWLLGQGATHPRQPVGPPPYE